MISDIQNTVYLKKVFYLLENEVGIIEERTNWLQGLMRDVPDSILSIPCIKEKVNTFCSQYNIPNSTICPHSQHNQTKKVKNDRSTAKRIFQNECAGVLSELSAKLLDKQRYYQTLEEITTVIILENDFKKIPEIEYKIQANIDDPILSDSEHSHSVLSPVELRSLRKTKALICFSFFLQGRYLDCVGKIFQFFDKDNKLFDNSLWSLKYDLLQADDFYSVITISALLALPLNEIKHFSQLTDLVTYFQLFPTAKYLFNSLKNTRFRAFFISWMETLNPICQRHLLMGPKLKNIEQTMRIKIYVFYLSISTRIQVSYLSTTLCIDYEIVLQDIQELFNRRKVNFVLEGDIISYKKRSILNDIASLLQTNEVEISKLLDTQNKKNTELKDSIQNYIIENNKTNDITITYEDEGMSSNRSNDDTGSEVVDTDSKK